MGYCMQQLASKFSIPVSKKAATLAAIKRLAGRETIADGSGRHFSWVRTEEFLKAATLKDAMKAWRWYLTENEDGTVLDIGFGGEKYGDEDVLFSAIAPYVEAGSYIEMHGEDGNRWRWVFNGKTVKIVHPEITW